MVGTLVFVARPRQAFCIPSHWGRGVDPMLLAELADGADIVSGIAPCTAAAVHVENPLYIEECSLRES